MAKKTGLLLLFLAVLITAGCLERGEYPINLMPETTSSGTPAPTEEGTVLNGETLRIGAFNIQVFGESKAGKPEVMAVLADIIRTYDIVAIQEIRDSSQTALPALVDTVNADGSLYSYMVSERLGRTTSKEQYAYVYNTRTVQPTGEGHTYLEPYGTDPFHRQPYIASFRSLNGNFDAVLISRPHRP